MSEIKQEALTQPLPKPVVVFEETYTAPASLGSVEVKAVGPLGGAAALLNVDFDSPGSVFNGLAIAANFLPGLGTMFSGALSIIGGLFGGPSTDEIIIDQLGQINMSIGKLSEQMSAGFSAQMDLQLKIAADLKAFMIQIRGDELEAFEIILEQIEGLQIDFSADLQAIFDDLEFNLNEIHVGALSEADLKINTELDSQAIEIDRLAKLKLDVFKPILSQVAIDIEKMWYDYLNDIRMLADLQIVINEYRQLNIKEAIDLIVANAGYLGLFPPRPWQQTNVDFNQVEPVPMPPEPEPGKTKALISQKEAELYNVENALKSNFFDYLLDIIQKK